MGRSKGIGGTDISAIVGMNPFKTSLDVWLDKTGQSEPTPDNENMWWGREMEPVLARRYEKETKTLLLTPVPVLTHPTKPFLLGSPDALLMDGLESKFNEGIYHAKGGVDFKTSGRPQEWGAPGTDEIPQHYIIQAEWYMGLTGAQFWDIAVLLMGFTRKFAIYRVHRDDELIGNLTEAGEIFWKDHVMANVCPPIDGSKAATEYLKRLYPQDREPLLEVVDPDIQLEIEGLRVAKVELKAWESRVAACENTVKAIIQEHEGLTGSFGKILWKKNRDGHSLDYKAMAAAHPEIAAKFMKFKPGARVFRSYFAKED
ncbi:MAG: YqaJ viral recombinase family nuclease [Dehalococcoidia bacterium]